MTRAGRVSVCVHAIFSAVRTRTRQRSWQCPGLVLVVLPHSTSAGSHVTPARGKLVSRQFEFLIVLCDIWAAGRAPRRPGLVCGLRARLPVALCGQRWHQVYDAVRLARGTASGSAASCGSAQLCVCLSVCARGLQGVKCACQACVRSVNTIALHV